MENFLKYRWFVTSEKKLVVGGKNAEQNEELIQNLIKSGKNFTVMHTKMPGSPFSIIQSEKISEKDLKETAVFTACFSRAWRENIKKVEVDIFKAKQIEKPKKAKTGTFYVRRKINQKTAELKLCLTEQNKKIRAVPFLVKNSISICPGKLSKEKTAEEISKLLNAKYQEVLMALPTGGFKIC